MNQDRTFRRERYSEGMIVGSLGSIACLTISGASEWTKVKIEI